MKLYENFVDMTEIKETIFLKAVETNNVEIVDFVKNDWNNLYNNGKLFTTLPTISQWNNIFKTYKDSEQNLNIFGNTSNIIDAVYAKNENTLDYLIIYKTETNFQTYIKEKRQQYNVIASVFPNQPIVIDLNILIIGMECLF